MKMDLRCMPCFVKQYTREIEGSDLSHDRKESIVREMLHLLYSMDYDQAPVDVSRSMHVRMLEMGASSDPYFDLKRLSTRKALDMVGDIEKEVLSSPDPIHDAVLVSLAGNVIDYGAKNELDLHEVLDKARRSGFRTNDHDLFRERLGSAREMVMILDNSGEVVFDNLLMRTIHRYHPSLSFKAVVKRSPLLNDVTREDALEAGIDDDYIEIVELPEDGWIKPEHLDLFKTADIIVSKGQGNFESLSDAKGVFFLLVVKCDVVSEYLGSDLGEMVLKYSGDG